MKRTKSMVYRETVESRELFLCAINNGTTNNKAIIPTLENLKRHCKRGNYDTERAIDAWYRVATIESNEYKKDFGYSFSNECEYGDFDTLVYEFEYYNCNSETGKYTAFWICK